MKSINILLVLFIAAIFPATVGSQEISGTVSNGSSGIANVLVSVYDNGNLQVASDPTDDNGKYVLTGLSSGNYKVKFSAFSTGYVGEWYNDKSIFSLADPISVGDSNVVNIDAVLERSGAVSGTVVNNDGAGVSQVKVVVEVEFNSSYYHSFSAQTDASGNYTVADLPSGSHKVVFYAPEGYASEWYNDTDENNAHLVTVTAPDTTTNINAVLGPGGAISGQVTSDGVNGIENVIIFVCDTNGSHLNDNNSTDGNGDYTVVGLPEGDHKVEFVGSGYVGEWYSDKYNLASADPVHVSALNTTTGINAVLETGGTISGRVSNSGNVGIVGVEVAIYDSSSYFLGVGWTGSNGNYTLTNVRPGAHKLKFLASDINYEGEWYNDKSDFGSADLIVVTSNVTTSGIDAVLDPTGAISGRVTNGSTGISGVTVQVQGGGDSRVFSQVTDSNGDYVVNGIPGGEYKIHFLASTTGHINEWYDDNSDYSNATEVSVVASNTTTDINAVLAPGGSISGQVTDGSVAISGVLVYVRDGNGHSFSATTDNSGDFTVTGIPEGDCTVQFGGTNVGYINEWYDNKSEFGTANPVTVVASSVVSDINAILAPGGSISGRVTDGTVGLGWIMVRVLGDSNSVLSSTFTQSNGDYTLIGLSSGNYRVEFLDWNRAYFTEWYNNKVDFDSANPLEVIAPNSITGIDVVLRLKAQPVVISPVLMMLLGDQ